MANTQVQAKYHYGVGRRKRSTARAKFYPGSQPLEVFVNKTPISEYFSEFFAKTIMNALANIAIHTGRVDLFINGGGTRGQSDAAVVAISKALLVFDEGLKPVIKMHQYNRTDIRKSCT